MNPFKVNAKKLDLELDTQIALNRLADAMALLNIAADRLASDESCAPDTVRLVRMAHAKVDTVVQSLALRR